jgi:adenylate cyclase
MSRKPQDPNEYWRRLLSGEVRGLSPEQRLFRALPSPPRCKLCHAPFEGPFAPILGAIGFRRWALNQQICKFCISGIAKQRGGAEIPVSLLYADVRGSTDLAETMAPAEFRSALSPFFTTVAKAVDRESGVIDHIVGDGVMAMWIPGFVGDDHPRRAVAAGRRAAAELIANTRFSAGVGVHSGVAYVGVVGEPGSLDFTVVGDTANTAARLGSAGSRGELVLSADIVSAAGVDTAELERRVLDLKGKAEPFPAWVERIPVRVEG